MRLSDVYPDMSRRSNRSTWLVREARHDETGQEMRFGSQVM